MQVGSEDFSDFKERSSKARVLNQLTSNLKFKIMMEVDPQLKRVRSEVCRWRNILLNHDEWQCVKYSVFGLGLSKLLLSLNLWYSSQPITVIIRMALQWLKVHAIKNNRRSQKINKATGHLTFSEHAIF